jgi:predicted porin
VVEDLGSGLKANVVLESGFTADTGVSAQGGRLFGRQAFVSLASNVAGEIRLGRQYTLHDEVMLLTNPFGNTTFLNPGANGGVATTGSLAALGGRLPLFIDTNRIDNAVQYLSPSFAGFRLQGMIAAGEGVSGRYEGVKGTYANGPLNVALSYEQVNKMPVGLAGVVTPGSTGNKIWELGANYDFGMAKVFAGYQNGKDLVATAAAGTAIPAGVLVPQSLAIPGAPVGTVADELKAYTVGVAVPFGAATVGLNYTRAKYNTVLATTGAAGADYTLGRIGVGATYSLSKLTTVYTTFSTVNGDLKERALEKQVFQVGLRKAF